MAKGKEEELKRLSDAVDTSFGQINKKVNEESEKTFIRSINMMIVRSEDDESLTEYYAKACTRFSEYYELVRKEGTQHEETKALEKNQVSNRELYYAEEAAKNGSLIGAYKAIYIYMSKKNYDKASFYLEKYDEILKGVKDSKEYKEYSERCSEKINKIAEFKRKLDLHFPASLENEKYKDIGVMLNKIAYDFKDIEQELIQRKFLPDHLQLVEEEANVIKVITDYLSNGKRTEGYYFNDNRGKSFFHEDSLKEAVLARIESYYHATLLLLESPTFSLKLT